VNYTFSGFQQKSTAPAWLASGISEEKVYLLVYSAKTLNIQGDPDHPAAMFDFQTFLVMDGGGSGQNTYQFMSLGHALKQFTYSVVVNRVFLSSLRL